jgi:hypothetical protein
MPLHSDSDSDGPSSPQAAPSTYDYVFVADKNERNKIADGMQKRDLKRLSRSPCKQAVDSDAPKPRERSPVRKMARGFVLVDDEPAAGTDPSK